MPFWSGVKYAAMTRYTAALAAGPGLEVTGRMGGVVCVKTRMGGHYNNNDEERGKEQAEDFAFLIKAHEKELLKEASIK